MPKIASLEWDHVQQFFEEHGCVVTYNPEMEWYQNSWYALEKAGLTCTAEFADRNLDQITLKLRALCLLVMYLGIYQAAGKNSELGGYFSEHELSWYLDTLNVTMEDIWRMAHRVGMIETDFPSDCEDEEVDEEVNDELLTEIAMEMVSESNDAIFRVLKDHYGGDIGLFASLWNSRFPPDKEEPLEDVVDPTQYLGEKVEIWAYVEEGMIGWSWI